MPNRMPKLFWKWLVCLSRTSTVTSDFNHPSKEYINCISSGLSAEMMSTQNNGQNSGAVDYDLGSSLFQYKYNFTQSILQEKQTALWIEDPQPH